MRKTGARNEARGPQGARNAPQYSFPFSVGQGDPYESGGPRRRDSRRPEKRDLDLLAATVTGHPGRVDDATETFTGPPEYLGSLQFRSLLRVQGVDIAGAPFFYGSCPAVRALNCGARFSPRGSSWSPVALVTGGPHQDRLPDPLGSCGTARTSSSPPGSPTTPPQPIHNPRHEVAFREGARCRDRSPTEPNSRALA